MWTGIYYIIVVIVAVWAVFSGYRKGFMRQMNGVLGVAFGIAAARMLAPEFEGTVNSWLPTAFSGFSRQFFCTTLTNGLIFVITGGIIAFCTYPVGKLVSVLGSGMLNAIGGALFRLFQFMMVLSIVYNLLVDLSPASDLTKSSRLHDGNIVEGVMKLAPDIIGFPGAEEVAYRQQLEDAKKIS